MSKCLEKDSGFNKLYLGYKKPILRFIYTYVKNLAICEELMQDVFLKAYKKEQLLSELNESAAQSYLFAIARSTALDYLRGERIREVKLQEAIFAEFDLSAILSESLENYYIEGEVLSEINDAINVFPEKERTVFIESEIEVRRKKDISRDHNISLYKIRKIQEEVKRNIKKRLNTYYDDDAA